MTDYRIREIKRTHYTWVREIPNDPTSPGDTVCGVLEEKKLTIICGDEEVTVGIAFLPALKDIIDKAQEALR